MMHLALAALLSLADVERVAVAHAPSVIAARAAITEQHANLRERGALRLPQAFANYAQAPQGGSVGTIAQRLTTVGAQINLDTMLAGRATIEQARLQVRVARAQLRSADRQERIRAAGLYFAAVQGDELLRLRERIVLAARADERAARLRYRAGDVPKLDIVRAQVALASAQADLATARADRRNARAALALEIGAPTTSLPLPTLAQLSSVPTLPPATGAAIAIGLRLRPQIVAARAAVAAQVAQVNVARASSLPGVTAQLGYTSGIDGGINVHGPSANVTLAVPLANVAGDRVAVQRALLAQARERLALARRNVAYDIESAVRSYSADLETLAAAIRARDAATAELTAAKMGYREGASSSLDLQDARRAFAQAAIGAVSAQITCDRAAATLSLIMGESR